MAEPGAAALHMTLPKAGVGLLDQGHLLRREFDRLLRSQLFQLEPALIFAAHPMLDQDVLHGRRTDRCPPVSSGRSGAHSPMLDAADLVPECAPPFREVW